MRYQPLVIAGILLALVGAAFAAPPVELELATESGVQITAPQQWLQLLTAARASTMCGSQRWFWGPAAARKSRHRLAATLYVVGILSAGEELRLPAALSTPPTALDERLFREDLG